MKSATASAKAVEKTLHGKVQKQTFPRSLEIPQRTRDSHFSHSLDCYCGCLCLWTHWLRPKPAKMAPFLTGVDRLRYGCHHETPQLLLVSHLFRCGRRQSVSRVWQVKSLTWNDRSRVEQSPSDRGAARST